MGNPLLTGNGMFLLVTNRHKFLKWCLGCQFITYCLIVALCTHLTFASEVITIS